MEIHVLDTGIGVAAEHQDKLFDEFEQFGNAARDAPRGARLGLATARRTARASGGDLTVARAPAGRTRFALAVADAVRRPGDAVDVGAAPADAVAVGGCEVPRADRRG